jgi:hypothetical protein
MRAPAVAFVVRALGAVASTVGVVVQLGVMLTQQMSIVDFFSYFTIESNVVLVVVFAIGAAQAAGVVTLGARFASLRGAATIYMAFTGLVFNLILASGGTGDLLPWVNLILHQTMPVVAVLEWFIWPPAVRLPLRVVGIWLIYPLAYLAYSLIRGPITGFYAYPFFDPAVQGGYGGIAAYCGALLVAFLILGLLLRGIGTLLGRLYGGIPPRRRIRA